MGIVTRKPRTVLLIMVAFKYDYEQCPREALAIAKATRCPVKAGMHSKRQIAYVVQSEISAAEMMERVGGAISAGCVENAWCFTPAPDISARDPLDPLTERVAAAWAEVHRYNKAAIRPHRGGVTPDEKRQTAQKRAAAAAQADRDRALRALSGEHQERAA